MSRKHPLWKFWWWFGANPAWDFIKFIGGTTIVSALWNILKNEIHRHPVDWILFAGLVVVGLLLVSLAVWQTRKSGDISVAEPSARDTTAWERNLTAELKAERKEREQAEQRLLEVQFELEKSEERPALLTPLQVEILTLARDLRKLLRDAGPAPTLQNLGPMPKGGDAQTWINARMDETGEWTEAYAEWARRIIYRYQQDYADRVRRVMISLGAQTGMVVVSLEPYTKDVRPGYDFQNLIDLLLGFLVKVEVGQSERLEAESVLRQDQETLALYQDGVHADMMRKILEHPKMGAFLRNAYSNIDEWKKQNEAQ
jgi:hypothetical protein